MKLWLVHECLKKAPGCITHRTGSILSMCPPGPHSLASPIPHAAQTSRQQDREGAGQLDFRKSRAGECKHYRVAVPVSSVLSASGFQWSGCSDNIAYGVAFSQSFVDIRERSKGASSNRALMNLHNNEAGRKVMAKRKPRQLAWLCSIPAGLCSHSLSHLGFF